MQPSILLPLDGSSFSEHALAAALDLTRRLNGRLHLVHVHEAPAALPGDAAVVVEAQLGKLLCEQESEYLRRIAERCAEAGVTPRTELLQGSVPTALASYIQDAGIELVVMTTHGRGGISRAWVGSVADAVVRRSAVPVVLLRPHDGGTGTEPLRCGHLLVTLDGSPLAEGVLEPVRMLARVFAPRLSLLRVVAPLQVAAEPNGPAVLTQDPVTVERAVHAAGAYLETVAAALRSEGLEVDTAVRVHSVPAVAILDHAATQAVDMIAMATHGRGGWSRVAIGSVADKVMRGTLMPVLLYRPPAALGEHDRPVRAGAQAVEL